MGNGFNQFNLNAKKRVIKSSISLNKERPFFSYILLGMNVKETENSKDIPTMGVNQYGDLYWNEEFVEKLSDEELKFVMAHETLHVATITFQREGKKDHMIWNIATDLVINQMLRDEGFTPPKDICMADSHGVFKIKSGKTGKDVKIQVAGKVAEEVYDQLINNAEDVKIELEVTEGDGDGQGGGNGSYKGSIDSHIPGGKDDNGEEQDGKGGSSNANANEQKWKQKAAEAAASAKMRGKGSSIIERMLNGILEPKIDWRKKLHHYMTKEIPVDYTMRAPGRRTIATGIYMPTIIRENLEILVGIDCSGSIDYSEGSEGHMFLSEVLGIANSFPQIKMRIIAWADSVDKRDDIEVTAATKYMLEKWQPVNSGGTTLSKFTKYVKDNNYTNSRICVILTDGYIESSPKLPDMNCLFVLSEHSDDSIVKKYGDVTCLNDIDR